MKSILIIGMGRFGHYLCNELLGYKNEIMVIDKYAEAVDDIMNSVTSALVADCTKEDVIANLDVSAFDVCFVCIGDDFQSALEITSLLKDYGATCVVSLAERSIHAKFLSRNGADDVIYPTKDIAERIAVKYSNDNIFDYIELESEYSIYEITPIAEWINKSLKDSNMRSKYNISVIGIKSADGTVNISPSANCTIKADDHLMVLAQKDEINKILKRKQ